MGQEVPKMLVSAECEKKEEKQVIHKEQFPYLSLCSPYLKVFNLAGLPMKLGLLCLQNYRPGPEL